MFDFLLIIVLITLLIPVKHYHILLIFLIFLLIIVGFYSYEDFSHRRSIMRRDDKSITDAPFRFFFFLIMSICKYVYLADNCTEMKSFYLIVWNLSPVVIIIFYFFHFVLYLLLITSTLFFNADIHHIRNWICPYFRWQQSFLISILSQVSYIYMWVIMKITMIISVPLNHRLRMHITYME
jgi:hypothetical protein